MAWKIPDQPESSERRASQSKSSRSKPFHFLPPQRADVHLSARDHYLQQSDIRSHAARVSFSKSRRKSFKSPKEVKSVARRAVEASTSCSENSDTDDSGSRHAADWYGGHNVVYPPLAAGGIDPFLRLAGEIPLHDRSQLQQCMLASFIVAVLCLRESPDLMVSTLPHGRYRRLDFCPIRDVLLPKLAMTEPLLQCMLLLTDVALGSSTDRTDARRYHLIRQIQRLLNNPMLFDQPSTAITLTAIISAEYHAGNAAALDIHGKGLCAWLRQKGGLNVLDARLDTFSSTALACALVYFDLPLFASTADVELALRPMAFPFLVQVSADLPLFLRNYAYTSNIGSQIAVLYILNQALSAGMMHFLQDLDDKVQGESTVASVSMLTIILNLLHEHSVTYEPLSLQRIVEFVRLLSFASSTIRGQMVQILVNQLLWSSSKDEHSAKVDAAMLRDDIYDGWMLRYSGTASFQSPSNPTPPQASEARRLSWPHSQQTGQYHRPDTSNPSPDRVTRCSSEMPTSQPHEIFNYGQGTPLTLQDMRGKCPMRLASSIHSQAQNQSSTAAAPLSMETAKGRCPMRLAAAALPITSGPQIAESSGGSTPASVRSMRGGGCPMRLAGRDRGSA